MGSELEQQLVHKTETHLKGQKGDLAKPIDKNGHQTNSLETSLDGRIIMPPAR